MATRPSRGANNARRRRARGSITPEEVIRGAFELCEAESVDKLSMPRLANHLDVGVTSIYWYFKSKEDLLDALTEEALRRFYDQMPPLTGHKWDDVLHEFFTNFRRILHNDDTLCDLGVMRYSNFTDVAATMAWERIEEILEILIDAGFTEDSAIYAYFTLSVYTRGSIFVERLVRAQGFGPDDERHMHANTVANMPILARALPRHARYMVSDDDFEFGLDNNIRGLKSLLAAERKQNNGNRSAKPNRSRAKTTP